MKNSIISGPTLIKLERTGLSLHQAKLRDTQKTWQVMTQGLGANVFARWFTVVNAKSKAHARVSFRFGGKRFEVFGFFGFKQVFALFRQEEDQIIASFHADEEAALDGKKCLKKAVFSEKRSAKNGGWSVWVPACPPKVIYAPARNRVQSGRINANEAKRFLLGKQEEGAAFNIPPRLVMADGAIHFIVDERPLVFGGYSKFVGQRLPGRFRVMGGEKRAFFWQNAGSRRGKEPAILPRGHLAAERDRSSWKIVWGQEHASKYRESLAIGKFLYSSRGDEARYHSWPVHVSRQGGYERRVAYRTVRGVRHEVYINAEMNAGKVDEVFSRMWEIAGQIKLVDFWPCRPVFELGRRPFASRFITIRTNGNGWESFWKRVDEVDAFRMLVEQGKITLAELETLFSHDYMVDFFPDAAANITDVFKLY